MLGNGVLIDGLRWPTLPSEEFRAESTTSAVFKGPLVPSDGTVRVTLNTGLETVLRRRLLGPRRANSISECILNLELVLGTGLLGPDSCKDLLSESTLCLETH